MRVLLTTGALLALLACSNNINDLTQRADPGAVNRVAGYNADELLNRDVATLTPVELSQYLLAAQKRDRGVAAAVARYENLDPQSLADALPTDAARKAFWINTYNGFIQYVLQRQPELYEDRGAFFKAEQLAIAGQSLSFDDIEHGIIRHGRAKLSAGYLPDLLDSDFEEKMATSEVDPRIHFAVNCGAIDCPPVHVFDEASIDQQLDALTKRYLEKTTSYDAAAGTVRISPLMNWFRGDFGGKNSTAQFLKAYEVIPQDADPKISYGDYDWTLALGTYGEGV